MDGGQGRLAVGGTGGWSGLGHDQGGEKGEETEGVLGSCSPQAERGSKVAGGGPQWRPAAASRCGGAPVLPRPREEAEEARLDVAELLAGAISPIEASMRRIERWPAVNHGGAGGDRCCSGGAGAAAGRFRRRRAAVQGG
jgi:hypothetical protein